MVMAVPARSSAELNCLREGAAARGLSEAETRIFQDGDRLGATVGTDGDSQLHHGAVDAFDVGFGREFTVIPAAGQGRGRA